MTHNTLLEDLSSLAREPSGERRRELLRSLTDLFDAGTPETKTASQDLFGDVVSRVLDEVTVEIRAEVSERLSDIEESPRELMVRLANDHISVASPVLRASTALTDDDLVEIAANKSQEHLLAISDRRDISEQVTDSLVQRGNQAVLHSVSGNDGARFSEQGFSTLTERAAGDETLQQNLVARKDLTAARVKQLRPMLTERLRERLDQAGISAGDAGLEKLVSTTAQRVEMEMREAQRGRLEIRVLISEVRDGKRHIDQAVEKLCASDRALDVALLIKELSDVGDIDVTKIMFKEEGGPIAVLCKNLGVGTPAYAAIVRLRNKRFRRASDETRKEIALYESLAAAEASRAIRFLKVRRAAL